jgi:hypothetical protein
MQERPVSEMWKLVSEARYWEMLGCLPPAVQTGAGFLVGEPWRHDDGGRPMFAPFLEFGGKFYEGIDPMTIQQFRAITPAVLREIAQVVQEIAP